MKNNTGIFAEAHRLEEKGEAFALALIIESEGSTPRQSGRMIVRADGSTLGTVGGGAMESQVIQDALEALAEGKSRTISRRLVPTTDQSAGMECGGAMSVRIDIVGAPPRLLLVGGGHVNLAIARAAEQLGFRIELTETRTEFCNPDRFPMAKAFYCRSNLTDALTDAAPDMNTYAVIASHSDDLIALRKLVNEDTAYLGMLGSKRKVAVALAGLRKNGVAEDRIAAIRSPIGLDIGAESPEEIAVSVLSEILKIRSGRSGLPLQGMSKDLVVIRGGGDLASGCAWRLSRCGFRVVILEISNPTVIRRKVAYATAINDGQITVEGIRARRADNVSELYRILNEGDIPVLADPECKSLQTLKPSILVDAILARKNIGTSIDMAAIVVALGPGFEAGRDCNAVVETARGNDLGRVILSGAAAPDTGTPGIIAEKGTEGVLRAPRAGSFEPVVQVGEIDPRDAEVDESLISDKARAVAGGVLEAIFHLRSISAGR